MFLTLTELLIEGIAGEAHLFYLVLIVDPLLLQLMAVLSEFLYLHFVVEIVVNLPICVLEHHAQGLYLERESFDFYGLEDNNELQFARKVNLLVARKVLDPRSK